MSAKTIAGYLLVLAGCFISFSAAAADEKPSGTVKISELQVMVILGGDHGHGTLDFGGGMHAFSASGLKLGGIGVHKKDMTGEVYRLNKLDDFNGVYFLAEAGLTVAKGVGGVWLKNHKGVTMHLKSATEGLALSIGVEGFKVKLQDHHAD